MIRAEKRARAAVEPPHAQIGDLPDELLEHIIMWCGAGLAPVRSVSSRWRAVANGVAQRRRAAAERTLPLYHFAASAQKSAAQRRTERVRWAYAESIEPYLGADVPHTLFAWAARQRVRVTHAHIDVLLGARRFDDVRLLIDVGGAEWPFRARDAQRFGVTRARVARQLNKWPACRFGLADATFTRARADAAEWACAQSAPVFLRFILGTFARGGFDTHILSGMLRAACRSGCLPSVLLLYAMDGSRAVATYIHKLAACNGFAHIEAWAEQRYPGVHAPTMDLRHEEYTALWGARPVPAIRAFYERNVEEVGRTGAMCLFEPIRRARVDAVRYAFELLGTAVQTYVGDAEGRARITCAAVRSNDRAMIDLVFGTTHTHATALGFSEFRHIAAHHAAPALLEYIRTAHGDYDENQKAGVAHDLASSYWDIPPERVVGVVDALGVGRASMGARITGLMGRYSGPMYDKRGPDATFPVWHVETLAREFKVGIGDFMADGAAVVRTIVRTYDLSDAAVVTRAVRAMCAGGRDPFMDHPAMRKALFVHALALGRLDTVRAIDIDVAHCMPSWRTIRVAGAASDILDAFVYALCADASSKTLDWMLETYAGLRTRVTLERDALLKRYVIDLPHDAARRWFVDTFY